MFKKTLALFFLWTRCSFLVTYLLISKYIYRSSMRNNALVFAIK